MLLEIFKSIITFIGIEVSYFYNFAIYIKKLLSKYFIIIIIRYFKYIDSLL
jgi:hypothetical protein